MRDTILIILLAIAILSVSCNRREYKTEYKQDIITGKLALVVKKEQQAPVLHHVELGDHGHVKIVFIDQHEYVILNTLEGASITHHEGCKHY
jgi:hypothetical protein